MTQVRAMLLSLAVAAALSACGGGAGAGGVDDPLPSAIEATSEPSTHPEMSPPDTLASPPAHETDPPTTTEATTTQTDTEWGRIWDDVPAGFPVYPGAVRSEEAGGGQPVSATFTIAGGDAIEDVVASMQAELEIATYSTFALSGPLEDGGYVIDSVGDGDCRLETRISPAGDMTIVAVRFGAACPFD